MNLNREQRRLLQRFLNESVLEITKDELIERLEKIISEQEPNIILTTDGYKLTHPKFYPKGLTYMISYLESRGGKFHELLFFGLQYILKKYFVGPVLSQQMIDDATKKLIGVDGVFSDKNSFNPQIWQNLLNKHDGTLPLLIKAVEEGSIVDVKNVLMTIESTDEEFAWVVGLVETVLLRVFYPITVGTLSREIKKVIAKYLKETGSDESMIPIIIQFILNGFGARGVSSEESCQIGDAAHLVNFMGSDCVTGSNMLTKFYNTNKMWGKSIDALEHSITTMLGRTGELDIYRNALEKCPTGYLAIVSDGYDIKNAVSKYFGEVLKDIILARDGVVVLRPDSGSPIMTLKIIFGILFEKFGYTLNSKGFKLLPKQIRVIQGDSVNYESITEIYEMLKSEGIAAENLVLGMGGKLLQSGIDRDTQNFAIKACFCIIDGIEYEIEKSPMEFDEFGNYKQSFKKSKKGRMKLIKKDDDTYETILQSDSRYDDLIDELIPVFKNGILLRDYNFEEIRERAEIKY